ncbi:MAG: DUF2167 domain-containing protein [Verrucomicrobia bacterium]|nr:DUF2167 domain-containing protein [Verrucomicrobiota bacterium]
MKKTLGWFMLALMAPVCLAQETPAEEGDAAPVEDLPFLGTGSRLNWVTEGEGALGSWATIKIPEGMGFLNGADTATLMSMYGNLPDSYEGALSTEALDWTVIFQFSEEGYVKDDEKDDLDADEILKTLKEGQDLANAERKKMGFDTLVIERWAVEPKYNESTNNLEWGTVILSGDGSRTVNYETRLLGREGYMNVTLLCDPEDLDGLMSEYQALLASYAYVPGKTYGEYEKGDKLASYGLTALIAGGAAYGAVKTGLLGTILVFFKKLWYVVVAAIAAVWKGIKRFFGRITGTEG